MLKGQKRSVGTSPDTDIFDIQDYIGSYSPEGRILVLKKKLEKKTHQVNVMDLDYKKILEQKKGMLEKRYELTNEIKKLKSQNEYMKTKMGDKH